MVIAARPVEELVRSETDAWWGDTEVELPPALRDRQWRSQIVRRDLGPVAEYIGVAAALGHLPSDVLVG